MSFLTDRSRLGGKVEGAVLCKELSVNLSFKMPEHCSIFKAEAGVKVCLSSLEIASSCFIIRFAWVPGLSGITGHSMDLVSGYQTLADD